MVLLGLLLIVLAAGAAVWLVLGSQSLTTPVDLSAGGAHVGLTPLALLIAGAAVLLVFGLGLAMIRGSVKRRRRPGREAKDAQRHAELEENIRADERTRADETHQSALVERDRVRDEEYQSQLAERDRARDEQERTRMAEAEARIRADERAKVENELRQRDAQTTPTRDAETATAVGGAAGYTGTHAADDAPNGGYSASDSPRPAEDDASTHAHAHEQSSDADEDPEGEPHLTVADKIMGRGPTGEA